MKPTVYVPSFRVSKVHEVHYGISLLLFLKVWDTLTTYKCVKTLEGHSGIVLALCTHEYVTLYKVEKTIRYFKICVS